MRAGPGARRGGLAAAEALPAPHGPPLSALPSEVPCWLSPTEESGPAQEREKSHLTRSVLSHTSMSSMTEGCATGIYGGGKQRGGEWAGSPTQPGERKTEHRNKENRQKQPPKSNQNVTHGQTRSWRGHTEWQGRKRGGGQAAAGVRLWGRGGEGEAAAAAGCVLDMDNFLTTSGPRVGTGSPGEGCRVPLLVGGGGTRTVKGTSACGREPSTLLLVSRGGGSRAG